MASVRRPSRARSADRLSSSRFIRRASGQSLAKEASIGTIECFRAWTRVIRMRDSHPPARPMSTGARRDVIFLLERQRVHQSALAPGRVQAAIEFQRARLADIALKNLAIVAA